MYRWYTPSSVSTTQGCGRLLLCTQLWCRSHSLSVSHAHICPVLLTHAHVCPKCIYTNTLYGLFTHVAPTTYYHYYYHYNNNNQPIRKTIGSVFDSSNVGYFRIVGSSLSSTVGSPWSDQSAPRSYRLSATLGQLAPPPTRGTYTQQTPPSLLWEGVSQSCLLSTDSKSVHR